MSVGVSAFGSAALSRDLRDWPRIAVGAPLWVLYAALIAVLGVVYFLVGADSVPQALIYQSLRPPARGRAWALFAVGLVLWTLGDAYWDAYSWFLHTEAPFPSIADVAYVAGYPLMIAATFVLGRGRARPRGRGRRRLDPHVGAARRAPVFPERAHDRGHGRHGGDPRPRRDPARGRRPAGPAQGVREPGPPLAGRRHRLPGRHGRRLQLPDPEGRLHERDVRGRGLDRRVRAVRRRGAPPVDGADQAGADRGRGSVLEQADHAPRCRDALRAGRVDGGSVQRQADRGLRPGDRKHRRDGPRRGAARGGLAWAGPGYGRGLNRGPLLPRA